MKTFPSTVQKVKVWDYHLLQNSVVLISLWTLKRASPVLCLADPTDPSAGTLDAGGTGAGGVSSGSRPGGGRQSTGSWRRAYEWRMANPLLTWKKHHVKDNFYCSQLTWKDVLLEQNGISKLLTLCHFHLVQLTCSLKLNWKAGRQASTLWQSASKLALRAYPKTSMHEKPVCKVKKTISSFHEWMASILHGKMHSTPQTTKFNSNEIPPLPSPHFFWKKTSISYLKIHEIFGQTLPHSAGSGAPLWMAQAHGVCLL